MIDLAQASAGESAWKAGGGAMEMLANTGWFWPLCEPGPLFDPPLPEYGPWPLLDEGP